MATQGGNVGNGVVSSFDIFDTVLTRRVANPRSVFLLLGRRLYADGLIDCSAHAFATARTEAEIRAFRNAGGLDSPVCLSDIHAELGNALHWNSAKIEVASRYELDLEAELLVPLAEGQRRVRQARERGERILYVSDMYLPSEFLEALLRDQDLFVDGDVVIVSNEFAASKHSGKLWPVVLSVIDTPPHRTFHVGNDARSDGRTARRAGLSAEVLPANNPNRYEQCLERRSHATDGLSSVIAGAGRIARLDPPDPTRTAVSDVAAGVVAPFVIGHLLWTLEVARRENLTELFFVARDGQLLCDVARLLAPGVGYEGKLTYTYGSRQAWALGGLVTAGDRGLALVIPDAGDVRATVRDALARVEIDPEEISLPLARRGFHRATWSRPMIEGQPAKLRAALREDPEISLLVRENAKRARDLTLGYLDGLGALTDEPIGFVDLGTGATLFNALGAMLNSVGQAPPMGFYFGLRSRVEDFGFGKPLTYVRDVDERCGFLNTPGLLTLMELACTADHGSVTGYADVDGAVVPVFDEGGNDAVVDWGLPIVHKTVCRVAREFAEVLELVGTSGIDLRPAALEAFNLFWTSPTKAEAAAWGPYPFEDGWGDRSFHHPLAEARSSVDVLRRQPYRHWWAHGAAQLSGPVTRKAFASRRAATGLASKVRRRNS